MYGCPLRGDHNYKLAMVKIKILHKSYLPVYLILLTLLSGFILIGCNYSKKESDTLNSSQFDLLIRHISRMQSEDKIIGAELLIIKNDIVKLHEVIGWSNREERVKLQKNRIFRIRSMTKPIIATAILMLIEESALSLDDRIATHIPAFDNPLSESITVRQLLTHTSGLGSHDFEDIGLSKAPEDFNSLEELVNEIGQIGPKKPPGRYYYSGSGTAVLTHLIGLVSELNAEEFVHKRIFIPLEMSNSYTSFNPEVQWASQVLPSYVWQDSINDFSQYWDPSLEPEYKYFRGHGGIYSTAEDYANFLSMWLNMGKFKGKELLSEKMVMVALSPSIALSEKAPLSHQSLAWKVLTRDSTDNEIGYFMHGGSDGTVAIAYPEEKTIALYFTQSRNHLRNVFENLMAITEPYDNYRKWNYNNIFLDQWKSVMQNGALVQNMPNNYTGQFNCLAHPGFNSDVISRNGRLYLKNKLSGFETELHYLGKNEFLCWFKPPPYGFLSKLTFPDSDGEKQSFKLEWINKTSFNFERDE